MRRLAQALDVTGALDLLGRASRWRGVLVVCHHRIGDPPATHRDVGVFSATQDELDAQLRVLRTDAELIAPGDLAGARATEGRCVLLTFDDGYADSLESALPVLRAHGAQAAFFVATSFVDEPRLPWWDELAWMAHCAGLTTDHAGRWIARYKSLPAPEAEAMLDELGRQLGTGRAPAELAVDDWLTWDGVRALRDAGMTIGGHTDRHPVLTRLDPATERMEIATGLRRLTEELGERPRWFAYPVGLRDCFGPETRAALRAEDVELAFSFYGGANPWDGFDPYDVRRIAVGGDRRLLRAQAALPGLFARPFGRLPAGDRAALTRRPRAILGHAILGDLRDGARARCGRFAGRGSATHSALDLEQSLAHIDAT